MINIYQFLTRLFYKVGRNEQSRNQAPAAYYGDEYIAHFRKIALLLQLQARNMRIHSKLFYKWRLTAGQPAWHLATTITF